ncbi:GH36-type glycosyl hydrolase domain-containing protein [Clostridium fungisolvens]|uniref:Cyclic beta-(1,2)-glucan synthase NdvB n=1 Tax=Clostridium fungisolvens TaxID=1604897 RepID=A0A6V8SAQ1_9CLOT|nr:glucoamylase family protein [Clostridium fungisolvens]GFP74160.1 Cyclic beta-(1,2)-glucan synthase NdvB [Clostridium fungisolvens]
MKILDSVNCRRRIMYSLKESYSRILENYQYINQQVKENKDIVGAAEWLLDNIYVIEKEYKTIKINMPWGYFENLPLVSGEESCPKIYLLAKDLLKSNDGKVEEHDTINFLKGCDDKEYITLGELWAFPLMLRVALIEGIATVTDKLAYIQKEKQSGEELAYRIIDSSNNDSLADTVEEIGKNNEKFSIEMGEKLFRVLRDNSIDNDELYKVLEKKITKEENFEDAITGEFIRENKLQLSMGNYITSLRTIDAISWKYVFDSVSRIEKLLSEDPEGTYSNMDFDSKDFYRHRVEEISRSTAKEEWKVVEEALKLCEIAKSFENERYKAHVGYYLLDQGEKDLEKSIGKFRSKKAVAPGRFILYQICLIILCEIIVISLAYAFDPYMSTGELVTGALIVLLPISEVVVGFMNWSITKLYKPDFLPKLDFEKNIPEDSRTLVVIPAIFSSSRKVKELMDSLEVYYIANKDDNFYFALLGDLADSKNEEEETDKDINFIGKESAKLLNEKYFKGKSEHFFFFNRKRVFNDRDNIWMGWERKRGKLMEFMAILRNDRETSYNVISGNIDELKKAKYLITLDADTVLPMGAGKKLVGAMAHILNSAIVNNEGRVIRGYGIMQPKVDMKIEASEKTIFTQIFAGDGGIDVYSSAASDSYQDLFKEGIFTGKGIINIDTFYNILKDEIPENTVLSHDLLEGSYTRCALLTDVNVVDGYPASYKASCMRSHRWIRGDWQILPWLFNKKLKLLSRWQIFDNLRRSIVAPWIVISLFITVIVLKNGMLWDIFTLLGVISLVAFAFTDMMITPKYKKKDILRSLKQVLLTITFLPNQCVIMLDAIIRTIYRSTISKKNMLQWQTSADVEAACSKDLYSYFKYMWLSSLIGVLYLIATFNKSISLGSTNLLISILWIISPLIAYLISKEDRNATTTFNEIPEKDKLLIRTLGRRTWAYYEDFVNEENNYLAPDNFQEDPNNGVAFRTSPTNMAMGLMSNIVARDMGYITLFDTVDRIEKILNSMDKLDKYHGHFLNWYDTRTRTPLWPRYVSTVDSGNLVGYLWVIEEALSEYLKKPLISDNQRNSLIDTMSIIEEEIKDNGIFKLEKETIRSEDMNLKNYMETLKDIVDKCLNIELENKQKELYWIAKLKKEAVMKLAELGEIIESCSEENDDDDRLNELGNILLKVPVTNLEAALNNSLAKKSESNNKEIQIKTSPVADLIAKINNIIGRLDVMATETDFKVLYNSHRKIFSIGYDMENNTLGDNCYDLLASEARAASFIAIAKGDVEYEHWFKLGRAITTAFGIKSLVSWSGTMFEYFMPALIMKNYEGTLWDLTYNSVIEAQKIYANKRGIPWGISESAFYHFDVAMNYQYKAFGVPGIGLKRGLVDELVVSPYSTVMALSFAPLSSIENMNTLINKGMIGRYGFYEAIDFTEERVTRGKQESPVKCFMVHHQGMSLMSLDNFVNENILQERFHKLPQVKAFELLLQEKQGYHEIFTRKQQFDLPEIKVEQEPLIVREYSSATENPEVLLLSNGSYSTIITNSGSGLSKKGEMTVNRWKSDTTDEGGGVLFYIKNLNSNEYWSPSYEPCRVAGDEEVVQFTLDKAFFKRSVGNIESSMEVCVSSQYDAEVRKITLKNNSESVRNIEITSYMEVTLAPFSADVVHPTFSNLFITTEYDEDNRCIIAKRRPRAKGQKQHHLVQKVVSDGDIIGAVSYETARADFIGRNRNLRAPRAMDNDTALNNSVGIILDPIISMRVMVKVPPKQKVSVSYVTIAGDSREEVMKIASKYTDNSSSERAFIGATQQVALEMKYLGIKSFQANLFQSLASNILFLTTWRRENEKYIKALSKHQRDLWPYGISGDLPILMLVIKEEADMDLLRQVINMHYYWRSKGLKSDLLIYNDEETSYDLPVQKNIIEQVNTSQSRDYWNKPGGIYLHSKSTLGDEMRDFLLGIAKLVISSDKGTLLNQMKQWEAKDKKVRDDVILRHKELQGYDIPRRETILRENANTDKDKNEKDIKYNGFSSYEGSINYKYNIEDLDFFNGYGGFKKDGSEYVVVLNDHRDTPAPWINVISNGDFGFHVSESGSAYTWIGNSRENKITPWNNDWVMDTATECLYLRDDINEEIWSITPKPLRDTGEYVVEHGFGYSRFSHDYHNINGKTTMFCSMEDNIKILKIELENSGEDQRIISLYYYAQLVLGVVPQQSAQYVSTYISEMNAKESNKDKKERFIWASNPYSANFGNYKSYLKFYGGDEESFTGDRVEFLGRNEGLGYPEALRLEKLSDTVGGGLDPCLGAQTKITMKPKEKKTLILMFGAEESVEAIGNSINKYSNLQYVDDTLTKVKDYWQGFLGTVKIKTPDKSMDYMVNGWLMYQTMSCRYWSRTAFYQSGGAYGYRDQLQDSMSLGILDETITRNQILRSASRQYEEGDVQHWWHPVVNSGIRTRFSDDLLWLPYVVAKYLKATGDYSVLEEEAPFLYDDPLKDGEDERYSDRFESKSSGTVYDHCIRAIKYALKYGEHNIPLMGSGDWNDGMSTVGNEGKGESVWLGWFLYEILGDFTEVTSYKNDKENTKNFTDSRNFILENLEKNAWDGGWYRRAYFDDGTPLGSKENDECRIDSLAQSWAAITGGGKPERVKEAMDAIENNLVKEDKGIILLLNPPFNNSKLEPGYIKGYVPGVRENGGQYTHAAVWVIVAMAKLGMGNKAWQYFNMINPINHSSSELSSKTYKVEPYVMAADVYLQEPHGGRGGWSWYTGASGWMYKAAVEYMLGFNRSYDKGFKIEPSIPTNWKQYEIEYNKDNMHYHIVVTQDINKATNSSDKKPSKTIILDGKVLKEDIIPYLEGNHEVEVQI